MKIQWSAFFSLLLLMTLVSCGSEQFGSVPKSDKSNPPSTSALSHSSCSTYTLIKPKVDVLYVVDNSSSSYYISSDIKNALSNTVNGLSQSFDYRVIGTPLLETASSNQDYQVMTNSPDLNGINSSKLVTSAGAFSFFTNTPTSGVEKGLDRVADFIDAHKNNLLRSNAYLVIVLVSNGRDLEVEVDKGTGNGETTLNSDKYNEQMGRIRTVRSQLNALQLRMLSVTAKNVCVPGYRTALQSYVKASNDLYADSMANDSSNLDSYDLCSSGGVSSIFKAINSSIQQVILNHEYTYWPIPFMNSNPVASPDDIRVRKVTPNGSTIELTKEIEWFLDSSPSDVTRNLRSGPSPIPGPGEPYTGRFFVRFASPVVYPDCILVTSVTKTEYFGFIALSQKPKIETVAVTINGRSIPKSATNGWSDLTSTVTTRNIKVAYPNAGDENPPIIRTGFMIQLNGPTNYYKSGDNVQVNFIPAGI